jgi:choline dehydrogenase-like flavoprotein
VSTDDADNDPNAQNDCIYNISSVPQPGINNRTIPILIGNCVGGSSAINAEVLSRGTIEEYAIWAELGGNGSTWNWDGMLPYFKKVRQ